MTDVSMEHYISEVIRRMEEVVRRTMAEHVATCPVAPEVNKIKIRFASLLAFMAGSGTLGGLAGGIMVRLLIGA